jgi:hypothetical protein
VGEAALLEEAAGSAMAAYRSDNAGGTGRSGCAALGRGSTRRRAATAADGWGASSGGGSGGAVSAFKGRPRDLHLAAPSEAPAPTHYSPVQSAWPSCTCRGASGSQGAGGLLPSGSARQQRRLASRAADISARMCTAVFGGDAGPAAATAGAAAMLRAPARAGSAPPAARCHHAGFLGSEAAAAGRLVHAAGALLLGALPARRPVPRSALPSAVAGASKAVAAAASGAAAPGRALSGMRPQQCTGSPRAAAGWLPARHRLPPAAGGDTLPGCSSGGGGGTTAAFQSGTIRGWGNAGGTAAASQVPGPAYYRTQQPREKRSFHTNATKPLAPW